MDGEPITNEIAYRESDFSLPAYIAVYNCKGMYEYALLDEEQETIVYIYLHNMTPREDQIADEYMPKHIAREKLYNSSSWDNTNIYYATNKAGDHVSCESNGHRVISIQ